eukprot:1593838-Prymnesium_polylepis.1
MAPCSSSKAAARGASPSASAATWSPLTGPSTAGGACASARPSAARRVEPDASKCCEKSPSCLT